MKHRDPAGEILEAYVSLLSGNLSYEGVTIPVGIKVPRKSNNYVHVFAESIVPKSTGDSVLFEVIIALEIVSMQATTEGDDTPVNSIMDQILDLSVDDEQAIMMKDFNCLSSTFMDAEFNSELTDTNFNIIRKLRLSNFIEQVK